MELRRKLSGYHAMAREKILEDIRIQIGISEDWRAEYSQNEPLRRRFFMLNREQLREVADAGIEIGAHTLSHPVLSQMPRELALEEILASRCRLEQALGRTVWALAYPFGNGESVGIRETGLAARAGFSCAFMNVADGAPNLFSFPRIHVSSEMTVPEFEAHISGLHQSIRKRFLAAPAAQPVA
jgi:hypothetical protein